ncbi:MAG TPA: DedA family protein/thiosulfate sulfurtransferase GlpE [Caldimonas sp.]|nr:DedA family protein/thiosulfate sulfurtransferase GlpE [Caldimonas sp.]
MHELVALLLAHGALIIFVVTLTARVGAPVPASPLLVVAGSLVLAGQLSVVAALATSIAANVLGDGVWFLAGRRHGHRVMKQLCRISLSPDSCVRQSESLITRWGGSSLIAAKFVPGVSVIAAPMAGALGMSVPRFLAFELVASLVWTLTYMALGMIFSNQIQQIFDVMAGTGSVATAVLVIAVAAIVAVRYWQRQRFLRELQVPRIGVDELHALMQQGRDPLVIDVRSDASTQLDARRIPGAISVHLGDIHAKAAELSPDREIVLYCNCPNEVSAARAAAVLVGQGLARARPLAGGLDAWVASGRATEDVVLASPVASIERELPA